MNCGKIALLFTVNSLLTLTAFSQTPDWSWVNRAGGNSLEFSTTVSTDATGNVIIGGYFMSPSITIGSTTLTTNGLFDVFIAKYDPTGNPIWAISAGGIGNDQLYSVETDASGNIYATGAFASPSITFGSSVLSNSSPATTDIFLVKLNSSGTVTWAKGFSGNDYDVGQCVVSDPGSGNIYLAGYLSSTSLDFGTGIHVTNGLADAFLAKFDALGNNAWSISSGGTVNDLANGVDVDNFGNVYITGGFASSSMTFGSNTLVNVGPGFPDVFTAKYDAAGNHIWSRREGGPNNDHTVAVDVDRFGNVFVAGHYHSALMTVGTNNLVNGGNGDPMIIKYTNAGNPIWSRSTGGLENDFGHALVTDSSGNAYLAGMFMSASITFGSTTLTNASMMMEDIFLTKYDSAGNSIWAKGGGANYSDYINGITIHPATNKLFVTGDFFSPSITLGSFLLTNPDNTGNTSDFFVGKLDVLTGASVLFDNTAISVYPNPFAEELRVTGFKFQVDVNLFNLMGEEVYSVQNVFPPFALRPPPLPAGIYLLKLTSEGKTYTRRISRM